MQQLSQVKLSPTFVFLPEQASHARTKAQLWILDIQTTSSHILVMAFMTDSPDTIVTTCGITSIKHSPGDARMPISAAKLTDNNMQVT